MSDETPSCLACNRPIDSDGHEVFDWGGMRVVACEHMPADGVLLVTDALLACTKPGHTCRITGIKP